MMVDKPEPTGGAELVAVPDAYDTIFTLEFEDPALSHIEVRMRLSYGLIDSGGGMATIDLDAVKAGRAKPEDLAKLRSLVGDFSGALVSWNLKGDDGKPLGTDLHTVRGLDWTFVIALISAFMSALQRLSEQTAATLRQQAQAAEAEADLPVEVAA